MIDRSNLTEKEKEVIAKLDKIRRRVRRREGEQIRKAMAKWGKKK